MVALGCKYLRICHLNNCATGVATQNDKLRKDHFIGTVEMVMNFFTYVAEETREWLAKLGVRSLEELIGRTDLLEVLPGETAKQGNLDLSPLLASAHIPADKPQFCQVPKNPPFDEGLLAEKMVEMAKDAIAGKTGGEFELNIGNCDRSIGARISGEIARVHGNQGMNDAPITFRFKGTAGQSFGVWNAGGLHLRLEGDANDYVGKGMTGGKIVITPPAGSPFATEDSAIIGNTCLYGATGGKLFATGTAGERFAVRNSGAHAVVEGTGDHCCEYMTGGFVCVLGKTGYNFGSGMTGGFAYVLDLDNGFTTASTTSLWKSNASTMKRWRPTAATWKACWPSTSKKPVASGAEPAGKPGRLPAQVLAGETESGQSEVAAVQHPCQPAIRMRLKWFDEVMQ